MNGYKALYKGNWIDVFAETSLAAQLEAARVFKARKSYDVTVILCEVESRQVVHNGSEL
jgi:hypothetical protein